MPKEDYIPVCEYDQKHKCDGTRRKEFFEQEDKPNPALVPAEYTISKLEDSLEKAKDIIRFAISLEKRPTFISISFCHDGDTYVNLSYDEDENKGE